MILTCLFGSLAAVILMVGLSGMAMSEDKAALALSLWPQSADAATRRSQQLLEAGAPIAARNMAIRALRVSPQNAGALRALAGALTAQGHTDEADIVMAGAARLGWRDIFIQRWVLDRSITRQDFAPGSRAADAMLRMGFERNVALDTLQAMIETSGGRAAVADRIITRPPWSRDFFRTLSPRSQRDTDNFAALMAQLKAQTFRPDDEEVSPFLTRLIAQGDVGRAVTIWKQLSPESSFDPTTGLADGDFTQLAAGVDTLGPFGWHISSPEGSEVSTSSRGEFDIDPALDIESDGRRGSDVVSQLLALPPGRYALAWEARLSRGHPQAFKWRITCANSRSPLLNEEAVQGGSETWISRKAEFTIPDHDCMSQTLAVFATKSQGDDAYASLDAVHISHQQ